MFVNIFASNIKILLLQKYRIINAYLQCNAIISFVSDSYCSLKANQFIEKERKFDFNHNKSSFYLKYRNKTNNQANSYRFCGIQGADLVLHLGNGPRHLTVQSKIFDSLSSRFYNHLDWHFKN